MFHVSTLARRNRGQKKEKKNAAMDGWWMPGCSAPLLPPPSAATLDFLFSDDRITFPRNS
jgi:hypothetical protein